MTAELYTEAQIGDLQVKAVVDLLVRRSGTYREIVQNRLFQKIGMTSSQKHLPPYQVGPRERLKALVVNANRNPLPGAADAAGGGQAASSWRSTPSVGEPHLFSGEPEVMMRVMRSGHCRYQEFGVGGSTLMAIHCGLERVVSVDSDPEWVEAARQNPEIDAAIRCGRVDIRHADIGPVAHWGHPKDRQHMQSWPTYIATAWDVWALRNEMPDLIFVDGRFRVACCLSVILAVGSDVRLKQVLRVLLHDVGPERPYYDEVFGFFDVVESVGTLRVMKIKPDISSSRVMSALLCRLSDQR